MSNLQRAVLPGSDDREDEDTIEMQLSPAQHELLVRAAMPEERETAAPALARAAPVPNGLAPAAIKQALAAMEPAAATRAPTPPARQITPAPRLIEVAVHPLPPVPLQTREHRSGRLYFLAIGGVILLALSVTIAYRLGARARPAADIAPSVSPSQITAPVNDSGSAPTVPAIQNAPAPPATPPPPAVIEEAAARPVRFRNPFDSNEVFEFPPGTSYAEARDAVAAMLLKRAQERRSPAPPANPDDPSFAQRT